MSRARSPAGPMAIIIAVFLTFAIGFVVIVLPVGLLITSLSRRLAVAR